MRNLELASALAFEPRKAFDEIAQRPRFWFPLLVVAICTAALTAWYYAIVDVQWFMDRTMRSGPWAGQLTAEQLEETISRTTRGPLMIQSLIALPLFLLLIRLCEAVYYLLLGKIFNVQRGFRQWFSMACWTSLPSALALVPAAFVLLTSDASQIPQEQLQPLSLNELFFNRTASEDGFQVLSNLSVLNLLGVYLAVVGVKHWSGRSWLFSVLYAGLPAMLILFFAIF